MERIGRKAEAMDGDFLDGASWMGILAGSGIIIKTTERIEVR